MQLHIPVSNSVHHLPLSPLLQRLCNARTGLNLHLIYFLFCLLPSQRSLHLSHAHQDPTASLLIKQCHQGKQSVSFLHLSSSQDTQFHYQCHFIVSFKAIAHDGIFSTHQRRARCHRLGGPSSSLHHRHCRCQLLRQDRPFSDPGRHLPDGHGKLLQHKPSSHPFHHHLLSR